MLGPRTRSAGTAEEADALGRRSAAVNLLVDDAEALGLAWIDVLDARGPAALPDELDLSGEVTP